MKEGSGPFGAAFSFYMVRVFVGCCNGFKAESYVVKSANDGHPGLASLRKANSAVFRANRCMVQGWLAQLFVEFHNELLSQFNHFVGVFFVLNLTCQVAPIVGSR
jgi:hypothetical protein